eukprot:TRINITY_DN4473_c0_g4_i1.p1 TRINITY_DN4473_c0_g4~~TRINITY_DN4473_c0_g4_i1.p1  ORF type:complete len:544 (+),score=124.32 TRINITY_DN4473_c0_g4_i1:36-1667(+)
MWRLLCAAAVLAVAACQPSQDEVALQKAVYKGATAEVRRLLLLGTRQVFGKDYGGQSCLMIASYNGNLELCNILIAAGGSRVDAVGTVGKNKGTALLFAAIGMEEKLKRAGVLPPEIESVYAQIVALLVEHGSPLNSADYKQRSPVHLLASTGSASALKALVNHKNAVKALGRRIKNGAFRSFTPLHLLADSPKSYVHICTHLIRAHNAGELQREYADAAWQLGDGRTCSLELMNTVKTKNAEILREVLGAVEEVHGREGVQVVVENSDIANYLIRHGDARSLEVLQDFDSFSFGDERYANSLRVASVQGYTFLEASTCEMPAAVDVVTDMGRDTFLNEYFTLRKPVVLKGAASTWRCTSWNVNHMLDGDAKALNSTVTVAEIPYSKQYGLENSQMPLRQYIEEHMKVGSHMYAFDNSMHTSAAADVLGTSYGKLAYLDGAKSNPPQWSFGADGSGSPSHLHQDAINGVCFGKKEWLMWPPAATFLSTVPAHEFYKSVSAWSSDYLTVTQHAGDLLYVPEGWGHAVLNVGPTLGVATEYYRAV